MFFTWNGNTSQASFDKATFITWTEEYSWQGWILQRGCSISFSTRQNNWVKMVLPLCLICHWTDNINYLALFKHPRLRPLSAQFLDVLEHVENDVLNVHCINRHIRPQWMSVAHMIMTTSPKYFANSEQWSQWQCLQRPSSVKSTLMIKNMNPLAPSFCPPTSVFTQPEIWFHNDSFSHKDGEVNFFCSFFVLF